MESDGRWVIFEVETRYFVLFGSIIGAIVGLIANKSHWL